MDVPVVKDDKEEELAEELDAELAKDPHRPGIALKDTLAHSGHKVDLICASCGFAGAKSQFEFKPPAVIAPWRIYALVTTFLFLFAHLIFVIEPWVYIAIAASVFAANRVYSGLSNRFRRCFYCGASNPVPIDSERAEGVIDKFDGESGS